MAVLSDVHANMAALVAVLAEVERAATVPVVSCGDLTGGPKPDRSAELVTAMGEQARFEPGNGERAVVDLARGESVPERERWMAARHGPRSLGFVAGFPFGLVVKSTGQAGVFCHGSPRSDIELVTPGTPAERIAELAAGIEDPTLSLGIST